MGIKAIKISDFHNKLVFHTNSVHNNAIKAKKYLFFGNWRSLKIQTPGEESITISVEWLSKKGYCAGLLTLSYLLTKHLDCVKLRWCAQLSKEFIF